jgi:hypothetical protein
MSNHIQTILRNATRKDNEKLNIITFVTHERYEPYLCKTGHNFYSLCGGETRRWNTKCSPIPANYHIISMPDNTLPIPQHIDPEIILSQNLSVHLPIAIKIKQKYGILSRQKRADFW